VARKDYRKLALELQQVARASPKDINATNIRELVLDAFERDVHLDNGIIVHQVYPQRQVSRKELGKRLDQVIDQLVQELQCMASHSGAEENGSDEEDEGAPSRSMTNAVYEKITKDILLLLGTYAEMESKSRFDKPKIEWKGVLPKLEGDHVIQIGTTIHRYGTDEIVYRHIVTLNTCDEIEDAVVEHYKTEEDMMDAWKCFITRLDPDILTGYNIFGFDMRYMWERVVELGMEEQFGTGLGRLCERRTTLLEQRLSSSALGDNFLYYMDMDGVVGIDMFKVMQRDQKLDSYKLDNVAQVFLGDQKDDLKPREIFEKFYGSSADRCVIARYCLQDCALVNRLMHKLKVLENNMGMGNVCSVPLSYLFMRGQGIKIFSLVAKECRANQYLIPVLRDFQDDMLEDEEGYEGAIVLEPEEGMYLEDPITVLDYSSLYPSSMIARNLSHDCYVNDPKYANMKDKGISYVTVTYDIYEGKGDDKRVVGKKECTFAQLPEGKKGIIPNILQKLLTQRKNTRKKMEYQRLTLKDGRIAVGITKDLPDGTIEITNVDQADIGAGFGGHKAKVSADLVEHREDAYSSFEQAVLDALQLAYKVTANSLYGQIGSRTSPIFWKDIAACTTATGREMIMLAKSFVETRYGAEVIYGDKVVVPKRQLRAPARQTSLTA
jgi:DNA polymerase elongation subunit (family B)